MQIKMKTRVKMQIKGEATSHSRTEISVRDVGMVIDEPEERNGTNTGPAPTETAFAALAGCTNTIGNKCAHKLGLDIGNLDITVVGEFDRRGVTLQEEIDVPFTKIWLTVEVEKELSDADLESLQTETAKYCPLSKLFKQAGTEIIEEWRVRQPA